MTLKHNLSQLGLATEMCIMTGLQSLQNELSLNESGEPKLKNTETIRQDMQMRFS